jgi:5-hydroxyisourate hydrolase
MSTSQITTHVLDATIGRPAAGVRVELLSREAGEWRAVAASVTDDDGRVSRLGPDTVPAGEYRLRFETGAYCEARDTDTFYPEVLIGFVVAEEGRHYHVPLLLSPFAYSTYRGS